MSRLMRALQTIAPQPAEPAPSATIRIRIDAAADRTQRWFGSFCSSTPSQPVAPINDMPLVDMSADEPPVDQLSLAELSLAETPAAELPGDATSSVGQAPQLSDNGIEERADAAHVAEAVSAAATTNRRGWFDACRLTPTTHDIEAAGNEAIALLHRRSPSSAHAEPVQHEEITRPLGDDASRGGGDISERNSVIQSRTHLEIGAPLEDRPSETADFASTAPVDILADVPPLAAMGQEQIAQLAMVLSVEQSASEWEIALECAAAECERATAGCDSATADCEIATAEHYVAVQPDPVPAPFARPKRVESTAPAAGVEEIVEEVSDETALRAVDTADTTESVAPNLLVRMKKWLHLELRNEVATFRRASPAPKAESPFEMLVRRQLDAGDTAEQFRRIAHRISKRIKESRRAIFVSLSNESDLALTILATATLLGQDGHRVLITDADRLLGTLRGALQSRSTPLVCREPLPLHAANVWFVEQTRPGPSTKLVLPDWPQPFDVLLAAGGVVTSTSNAWLDKDSAALVAIARIGVTRRSVYHAFAREAKDAGRQLLGCIVLGDDVVN